jgi:hypothetical protein
MCASPGPGLGQVFDRQLEAMVERLDDTRWAGETGVLRSRPRISSTIGYVLSGNRSISPETIRRVEESIDELKFTPHTGARSIRTRRTGVLAMALPLVYGPHNQVQMPDVWAPWAQLNRRGSSC